MPSMSARLVGGGDVGGGSGEALHRGCWLGVAKVVRADCMVSTHGVMEVSVMERADLAAWFQTRTISRWHFGGVGFGWPWMRQ